MRALNIIKTKIDLWLQRHYQRVIITCLNIVAVTLLMEICLYIQRHREQPLELHALALSLAVGTGCHIGYQHLERYFPYHWLDILFDTLCRIRFADFIVRRLLYQLQLASQRLPKRETDIDLMDPAIQQIFQQVQKDAYQAVQLFRRDANAVLDRKELCYDVLEEEEEELRKAGFTEMGLSSHLLRQLLGPYGEGLRSSA